MLKTNAPTNWEDIDGNIIYNEDTLETICTKTQVKVLKYKNEDCIKNKLGEIIPITNLQHSLENSKRIFMRKVK